MTGPCLYVFFASPEGRQMPPCPECGAQVERPERSVDYGRGLGHLELGGYLLPCGCDVAGVMWLAQPPVLVPS